MSCLKAIRCYAYFYFIFFAANSMTKYTSVRSSFDLLFLNTEINILIGQPDKKSQLIHRCIIRIYFHLGGRLWIRIYVKIRSASRSFLFHWSLDAYSSWGTVAICCPVSSSNRRSSICREDLYGVYYNRSEEFESLAPFHFLYWKVCIDRNFLYRSY